MKAQLNKLFYSLLTVAGMSMTSVLAHAATAPSVSVPITMTVTASVDSDKRMLELVREDIAIKRGKESLPVTEWVAAKGDRAGLDLFLLIDDASDSRLALQYDDLRNFINNQPATTRIGVGYMRNGTVQIVQDLTSDHARSANALRLPFGSQGAYGNAYLSVIDLMKRWPDTRNRHEVLMVTDGVDNFRQKSFQRRGLYLSPDVDSAVTVAQKTGTVIYTIYAPGTAPSRRNYWQMTSGQMGIASLADRTGGESFFLGLHQPVSFKPYLDNLQKFLDNQYLVSFSATPGKRPGLHKINVSTEIAGVELFTHDAVWVPVVK